MLLSLLCALLGASGAAAQQPRGFFQDVPTQTMMADSPITDYTVHVMIYVLIIGALITFLLGGAFAVINLGMMSKREEDQTGRRDPSDVGILKHAAERDLLPAEEDDLVDFATSLETRRDTSANAKRLREEDMFGAKKVA